MGGQKTKGQREAKKKRARLRRETERVMGEWGKVHACRPSAVQLRKEKTAARKLRPRRVAVPLMPTLGALAKIARNRAKVKARG